MPRREMPLVERIIDGRPFHQNKTTANGTTYFRCKFRQICNGTARLKNGRMKISTRHSEYCYPDEQALHQAQFRQALKDALQNHWYNLKELYDGHALIHPEAAATLPFEMIRGFMKRVRKRVFPPQPNTLEEFVERATDPAYARNLEYGSGRLSIKLVFDDLGYEHVLLYDEQFVRDEMAHVDRLFIDGTFRSAPAMNQVYQLVTIIGVKFGHGIPFVWIIMTTKLQVSYRRVFEHVKSELLPRANVRLVMSDFEAALRNAIVEVFPTAHSTGCNAHFDRAIYRKAKTLRVANLIRADEDVRLFFKKLLALAYLPANKIEAEFDKLVDRLPQNRQNQLRGFLYYFRRYWLGVVKPHAFSAWGLARRTNNISESYNSKLGHKLGAHPGPWRFLCKLLTLQNHAKVDVGHLRNNRRISRHARYSSVYKQKSLQRAWRDLYMEVISTDEFLEKAACLKGNIVHVLNSEPALDRSGRHYEIDTTPRRRPLAADPDYDRRIFAEDPPQWLLIDNAPRDEPVDGVNANAEEAEWQSESDEDGDSNQAVTDYSSSSDEEYDEEHDEANVPNAIEPADNGAEVPPAVGERRRAGIPVRRAVSPEIIEVNNDHLEDDVDSGLDEEPESDHDDDADVPPEVNELPVEIPAGRALSPEINEMGDDDAEVPPEVNELPVEIPAGRALSPEIIEIGDDDTEIRPSVIVRSAAVLPRMAPFPQLGIGEHPPAEIPVIMAPLPQPEAIDRPAKILAARMAPSPEPIAHKRRRRRGKKRAANREPAGTMDDSPKIPAPAVKRKHRHKRRGDARKTGEAKLQVAAASAKSSQDRQSGPAK